MYNFGGGRGSEGSKLKSGFSGSIISMYFVLKQKGLNQHMGLTRGSCLSIMPVGLAEFPILGFGVLWNHHCCPSPSSYHPFFLWSRLHKPPCPHLFYIFWIGWSRLYDPSKILYFLKSIFLLQNLGGLIHNSTQIFKMSMHIFFPLYLSWWVLLRLNMNYERAFSLKKTQNF